MMAIRDELSRRCILLKSVDEAIEVDDIRNTLSTFGENGRRFFKYVEKCFENDVRWIVLLESEKGALKCIQANSLTIRTEGNEVYNVDVSYCPECIIPFEWIEEESKTLHSTFADEDHRSMATSIRDTLNTMDVDNSLTENTTAYQKGHFDTSEPDSVTRPFSTETDQDDSSVTDCDRSLQTVSGGIPNMISDSRQIQIPAMIEEDFRTSLHRFTSVDQNMEEEVDYKGDNSYFKLEVFKKNNGESDDSRDIMDKEDTRNSLNEDPTSTDDLQESRSLEPHTGDEDKESSSFKEPYDEDTSGFECEDFPTSVHCSDESFVSNVEETSAGHGPKVFDKSDMMESSMETSLEMNINDGSEDEPKITRNLDMMESSMEKSLEMNINDESKSELSLNFNLQMQDKIVQEKYSLVQEKYIPNFSFPKTNVNYGPNSERQNSDFIDENLPTVDRETESNRHSSSEKTSRHSDMSESQFDTSDPSLQNKDNFPSISSKSEKPVDDFLKGNIDDFKSEESLQFLSEPNPEKKENLIDKNKTAETLDTKILQEIDKLSSTDLKTDPHQSQTIQQSHTQSNQVRTDQQVGTTESQKNGGQQTFPHTTIMSQTRPNQNTSNQVQGQMNWHPGFQRFRYPPYGQGFISQRMDMPQANWYYPHPMWHGPWPHNPPYPQGPMQTNPEHSNAAAAQPMMNPMYYNPQQGYHMSAMFPAQNSNHPYLTSSPSLENQPVSKSEENLEDSTKSGTKDCTSSRMSTHGSDEENQTQNMVDIDDRKKQKHQKSEKRHLKDSSYEDFDQECHEDKLSSSKDKEKRLQNDGEKDNRDVRPKTHTASTYSESDTEDVCYGINVFMSSPITEELLEDYFENTRRSGGDDIRHINFSADKDQVHIEFYDHKAVDRIIKKGTEHTVSGVTLFISRSSQKTVKPNETAKEAVTAKETTTPKVMDDYKILIRGLNPSTNQECLFDFLEVKCGIEAVDILYGEESDTVLVMFDDKPDIDKLKKICKKKPLDGHYLEVYKVRLSREIRVSNVGGSLTEDEIRYYFENRKKSDGGSIHKIELHKELGICIVTFQQPEVVERVCCRRHKLHNLKLEVEIFHRFLGLIGGRESRISVELPSPIIRHGLSSPVTGPDSPSQISRSGIDSNIIQFLNQSESHKRSLEKELGKYHAKVEWPSDPNSETLTFICLLDLNDSKAPQILKSWEKRVHDVIDHFLDVITTVYISVAKETWKGVMDGLQDMNIEHPEGVIVIPKMEDYTIVLVGHKCIIKPLGVEIEKVMSLEESKLQKQHQNVTITKKLKSYQIQILYRKKFGSQVKDIEVKIDLNKRQVIFCGDLDNINSLQLQMFETLNKYVSKKMQISTGMKKLIFKTEVSQMVNKEMQAKRIVGYWDINSSNNSLDMYAESISKAGEAIEILNLCILEKSVPMQGMLGKFLSTPRWKKTLASLEEMHQGLACIEGDRGSITVTGSKDIFDRIFSKVKQEVNDYIEINSVTSENIFNEEGIFQYIEKYQSNRKQEIVRPLMPKYQVTVSAIPGPSSFGYTIKGHIDGVEIAKKSLEQLMRSIQLETFLFSKTGAKEFFLSSKGHDCIRQAETMSKCIIKVSGKRKRGKKNDFKAKEYHKRGGNNRYQSEPVLIAQCQHDEKRIIKIMEGDMTKLMVDSIVNAANEDMSHGGGIAAAIVKAGGQTIQDECNKYIDNHGRVSEGEAIVSKSGRLPCKLIIHTVGPTWKDGKENEESLLKSAVIKSLQLASSKKMSSIAFPAISAGIFGYPLDLSTKAIVEAINDYLSTEWKNSTILEVYLCDIDQKTISSFIKALGKEYGATDVKMIESTDKPRLMREYSYSCSESEDSEDGDSESSSDGEQSNHDDNEMDDTDDKGATGGEESSRSHDQQGDISSRSYDQQGDRSSRTYDQHGNESPRSYDQHGDRSTRTYDQHGNRSSRSFGHHGDFRKPASQAMIKVKKEELSKHKADVIVNSTQSDLDLNAGILSRSLLMAAGSSMQVECRQKYPSGIKYGQVAVTKGGNLSCSYVYHGTLKRWDSGKGDAIQCSTFKNTNCIIIGVLTQTLDGDGNQGQTMESLVESCLELAGKHNVSSVAFPALGTGKLGYPADIAAKTMFQCIHRYLTQNKTTSIRQINIVIYPRDIGTLKAFESVEDGHNSNSYSRHESKAMKYPHSATDESSSEHGYMSGSHLQHAPQTKVGHLMVSIVMGDITKEASHVIVNSTMDTRDLAKGAVSKAILKAAGSQIQDECLQKGKTFTSDKPVVVTSGGNMHCKVIFHVKSQKEADEWEKVVAMCLFEAERRRFHSVSFPALGTGGLGCSPDDVAKAMFKAIRKFAPEPEHLKHIRIVVFQKFMVDKFITQLDKKESEGLFTKVKEAAGKVKDKITQGIKSLTEDDPKPMSKYTKSQRSKAKKVESISFIIYSDSHENIKKAKKKLEDSYSNEFNEKTLSGAYKDAIINLTEKQRAEIEKICQKHHVTVKTNRQKGLIELYGQKSNVADAHGSVSEYIHGEDKKKDTYDKAQAISKYVQWYYEDNNKKMKPFSPNVNCELETAYSKKERRCYIKDRMGAAYVVDFSKMEETILSQPGMKFKVERRETSSGGRSDKLPVPKTWCPMKHDDNLKVIALHPGDKEYEKVKLEFTKSVQAKKSIINIERIQNKFLYQQYAAKRSELKLKNGKNPERWLWHGTSPDTLSKINHNGFNRSYCGKNGTAYGEGVYFAVNASYSLGYCKADGSGQYHMYSVQVLTGDSCQGRAGMRVLPPKSSGNASHITYDSATDSQGTPNMFVIFHDSQAYPTYHIVFK